MPNTLAAETSPYLLQHAENPVGWLAWGDEALRRARDEDKPLLVSIGYSACHWCHVMAHESFEDPAVAAVMDAHFVCVKVDREERPDVDAILMEAVQGMTGHGGWPLNVFLTPEQQPFHGGTYFPPEPRQGMPSWTMVLEAVAAAWRDRRDDIRAQVADVGTRLSGAARLDPADQMPGAEALGRAVESLRGRYDAIQGGFGGAPKFPPHTALTFLLRHAVAEGATDDRAGASADDQADGGATDAEPTTRDLAAAMSRQTLRSMASGGIHDQLGGGFARYAVDATWTVPHFEKMLYDNALLARSYLDGWRLWGDEGLRRTAEGILAFLLRELRGPEGGFLTALDADSEGVEGRFYVWTPEQVRHALGPEDAEAAIAWFGVRDEGDLDGATVLTDHGPRPDPVVAERIRDGLLAARADRVRPGTDDKRVAGFNGLAIHAFAEAGALLGRADLLEAARAAADFVRRELYHDGRLRRTWKPAPDGTGVRRHDAVLEDHAYLLEAAIALYEADGRPEDLRWAVELGDGLLERFADPERGGFFSTAVDAEALLARRKEVDDAPIPSGGSSAALGLLRLAALTGEGAYAAAAEGWLRLLTPLLERHPQAVAYALAALDEHHRRPREVAVVGRGAERDTLVAVVRGRLRPGLVLAVGDGTSDGGVALLEGRGPIDGHAAAYVCERFSCRAPVTDADALAAALDG